MNQSILKWTDFNKNSKIFYIDNLCFFYNVTNLHINNSYLYIKKTSHYFTSY